MKAQTLIIVILSILGIVLFFSTMHDKKINANAIMMYRCENNSRPIFPEEYVIPFESDSIFDEEYIMKYKTNEYPYSTEWYGRGLKGLPDDIFKKYPCIETLNFAYNHLSEIPIAINDLENLHRINLRKNKITSLFSEGINYYQFRKLVSVDLSHNLIDTLDFVPHTDSLAISVNHKIKHKALNRFINLNLAHNKIKHIKPAGSTHRFKFLDISNNQLETFPNGLTPVRLDISNNKINGVVIIYDYDQLERLDISNQTNADSSKIEKILIDNGCYNLKELNVSHNHITEFSYIDTAVGSLNRLEKGNFSYNRLTDFPSLLHNNKRMKELDLSHNKISSLRFKKELKALNTLDLSNNQLSKIEQKNLIPYIVVLDLSHNQFTEFPDFRFNSYIKELDLSHNNIGSSFKSILKNLENTRIEKVNLSHNNINVFERLPLKYLVFEELNLSNNKIKVFDTNFHNNLRILDLSNNLLEEIICLENRFSSLETLLLNNNPNLKSFPKELISNIQDLVLIDIRNTNLDKDFLDFLIEYCKNYNIELVK